ncbi:inactive leucine-rich repeat receptor-like protein kinase-like [Dorcoceras hygrometricum]|uniref:non-specific serine/threonine protein kinase n=1 Tax=Dorcoceras hygrometricum TaxID=472368 RepID=A0A2Z7A0D0_9LAMI|nr:inactive leucine-rich repeat receptor-like protein kinase-like [Dorcoceras hygrometricum]
MMVPLLELALLCFQARPALVIISILFILSESICCTAQSDVDCLKSMKESLEDPLNSLTYSWNFQNSTPGYICKFSGIECWHEDENKVLNINLVGMGLKGEFPQGIAKCSSLTGLDLSNNNIYGEIPSNISNLITYVTTLDLSSNQLSGEIPQDLANCQFLNSIKLDNNQLSGAIPLQISLLNRIKAFSVANNKLTGPVPTFSNATIPAQSYAGNVGLCGGPLPQCQNVSKKTRAPAVIGAAVGGVAISALVVGIGMVFFLRKVSRTKKDEDPLGNKWARTIKDLMKATNDFSKENIIGSGRTGTMYKAVLEDGTTLMVKRLQDTQHSEKEFESEMATLGNVKHRNLVPLLGFCLTKKERLLVYKNMPNGNLHDKLHEVSDGGKVMDWPPRLKIAIGAAKGFSWLHHTCNPRIIHRNISSKCILLDVDYEPKISDFGLARLMNPIDTHLSTFVNGDFGEFGYVAPEYSRTLTATPKGDVYSLGVVLLELVTGEKPNIVRKARESFKGNLVEWISQLSSTSNLQDSIDTALKGKGYDNELLQFLKVSCNCVLPRPVDRPTMFEVYQLLRAIGQKYNLTTEDDVLGLSDVGDTEQLVELIVARDS